MTVTHVLAALGGLSVILAGAARLPAAAANVLRACVGVLDALHELRTAWHRQDPSATGPASPTVGTPPRRR